MDMDNRNLNALVFGSGSELSSEDEEDLGE
jgi:hypothetical protein